MLKDIIIEIHGKLENERI